MTRPVLYLDSNHISTLARTPSAEGAQPFLAALHAGRCSVAISLLHLIELSDPQFKDRATVGALLESLPVVWAAMEWRVFDAEATSAISQYLGAGELPVSVFYPDIIQGWGFPPSANMPLAQMLEAMAENPQVANLIRTTAGIVAGPSDKLRVQNSSTQGQQDQLRNLIRDIGVRRTPGGLHLPTGVDADLVIEQVGGIAGFPAFHVYQALGLTRLRDGMYASTRNDVIDESHAVYVPYAALTVLDRTTRGRFRSARLPHGERVFHRLVDAIPRLTQLVSEAA